MTSVNRIISQGREIHPEEQEIVAEAEEKGLCERKEQRFVLCSNPSDPDYEYIPNRDCRGKISLEKEKHICSACQRKITEINSKEEQTKTVISLKKGGIRDFIRKRIKREFDTNVSTVTRKYCGKEPEYVLSIESPQVNLFLTFQNKGSEYIKWCKIYDDNAVFLFIDEALPLKREAKSMQLPFLTLKDIYPNLTKEAQETLKRGETTDLADRSLKGHIAHQIGTDERILEKMKYDDFEHVVQNLLIGSIGNTQLLGATESGSGVPDGTLSLHFQNEGHLYMWDAKFVKYARNGENKTKLEDEYDKIFRHLGDMEDRRQIKKKFGEVQGIILFSPGIKESNIVRLAEFIDERQLLDQETWSGTVCYFTFDALLTLFDLYSSNKFEVKMKEEAFRTTLHAYLLSNSKHDDEPETIKDSGYDCLHIGVEDIKEVFRSLTMFEPEEEKFNVEQHMAYLDLVTN